ncbi:hypothetical protein E4U19_006702 [Claviceps sp. Clav32 group G5]|nr:hypothetical protein E4U19_006702 [Claviceps sp. Clav32 group G5]
MPAHVTHPQDIKPFRGDVGPSDLIQAMDSALVGETAKYVGENILLEQIVHQADDYTATVDDLALFESILSRVSFRECPLGPFRCRLIQN